jgi:hypothetical protein
MKLEELFPVSPVLLVLVVGLDIIGEETDGGRY